MSKGDLVRHISAQSGVDTKGVKAVLGALENTMLGSVHKKGAGQFVMPGLFKVTAQAVAGEEEAFRQGSVHRRGTLVRRQAGKRAREGASAEEAQSFGALISVHHPDRARL